jgi:mycothiol S-conjugate amidase
VDPLTLLTVHAHPDDESSKGPATVARYHAEGVRTVLVTCTGGEEGEVLNPAMDQPGVKEHIAEVRREELEAAAGIIGYDEVVWLGYRDSGMPDSAANADPSCFARAPLDEAVGRLVAVIRRTRPQVVVTYPDEQKGYPHPDHLRTNEISELAFDAAGDPSAHPEAGPAWQPSKLYYVSWSIGQMRATHDKFIELGLESPFTPERIERFSAAVAEADAERRPVTVVDVTGFTAVRRASLRAHRTQVDPTSPMWFGLPDDVAESLYPFDEYICARDLTGRGPDGAGADTADGVVEDDLFAGIRDRVSP